MRRRRFLQLMALTAAVALTALLTAVAAAWHVPAFYRRTAVAAGPERRQAAQEFLNRLSDLFGRLKDGQPWAQEFPQDQVNSYLQDDTFTHACLVELPAGVSGPRVEFTGECVRAGFRYGDGWLSAIVSLEGRVWLAAKEPNVLVVELTGLSLGAIPLATHMLLEPIAEAARDQGIDATWYRGGGHPIALLRLQAHQPRPTFQLRAFETQAGKLVVSGKEISDESTADTTSISNKPDPQPAD